jgi:hypothetical protein
MTEFVRILIIIMSFGGFAGMIVLTGVYRRKWDRRAPLPIALAIFLATTAQYNAMHIQTGLTLYSAASFAASALALLAVIGTGLWGRPKGIATTNGNGNHHTEQRHHNGDSNET